MARAVLTVLLKAHASRTSREQYLGLTVEPLTASRAGIPMESELLVGKCLSMSLVQP